MGRLVLIVFMCGSTLVHTLSVLPGAYWLGLGALISAGMVWLALRLYRSSTKTHWRWVVWLPAALLLGFILTSIRAHYRLSSVLPQTDVNRVARAQLQVVSLPVRDHQGIRFLGHIRSAKPKGLPELVSVSWNEPRWRGPYAKPQPHLSALPDVKPGQLWRMALVVKPVHGSLNPGGFDYERYAFANGVRAQATVRGTPWLLGDEPATSIRVLAHRMRYAIKQALSPYVDHQRFGAVLLALAIGDQAAISAADWKTFNRTGLTHLVAISGTHISLVAGLVALLVSAVWRRVFISSHGLAERVPAQIAAGMGAMIAGGIYCLLAGWGVPAQRSFFMLAVVVITYMLRVPLGTSQVLVLAAFVVTLIDPWAVLSSGFWLSFAAVSVLVAAATSQARRPTRARLSSFQRVGSGMVVATRLQILITLALFPVLALLFAEISLVSPVANAYAIALVSLVVTPLSLIASVLALWPPVAGPTKIIVETAHTTLAWMMVPTKWLADLPFASVGVTKPPVWTLLLALIGVVIGLLPRLVPGQVAAWGLLLPALMGRADSLAPGEWRAHVLDVGQAGSIVVETANHAIVFDTGIRHSIESDSAERVIKPFLRQQGIRELDVLVLSHADLDHVGGLRSLLLDVRVHQSFAPFDVRQWLLTEADKLGVNGHLPPLPMALSDCHDRQHWEVDNVRFHLLWPRSDQPSPTMTSSRQRNDHSCVLSIRGSDHALLLPGDINAAQEEEIVQRGLRSHDVVVAAHHGSRGSSSPSFVNATQASHVVMQAGAWSRYGHPHPDAIGRWQSGGSTIWRSDRDGAVIFCSCNGQLTVDAHRQVQRRYWHHGALSKP